jgi:hypothetical protein
MICNHCAAPMVPSSQGLVPAMECVNCGRLVPRTRARPVRMSRVEEKAMLRAARRQKLRGRL